MFKDNIVYCKQGLLRGASENGITVFRGVPFAQPPVGALRWREPQPPHSWGGIRPAVSFSAIPVQRHFGFGGNEAQLWQSEDCLYLNIWTPGLDPEDKLPVFVWFYGGAYMGGRADDPSYDGSGFAKKGVIAVTVNYRVGTLGFLCHPDMKSESPYGTGGNFGLLDQIEALKWLRVNITAFGGDPSKITIGGQSAGSNSCNNLMCSPLSRDLFRYAINQSGDVFQSDRDISFDAASSGGLRLAAHFGCKTLNELRKLPVSEITRGDYDAGMATGAVCTPVIDGAVIPESQGNMLLRNKSMRIPIILGSNLDEGSSGPGDYLKTVTDRFGLPKGMYPGGEKTSESVMRLARDYWYARHLAWAKIRTEDLKIPTWQYVFARRQEPMGAMHGAEIPYAFQTLYNNPNPMFKYTEQDTRLMDIISSYWANFIKTGDPNGEGLPRWDKKIPDSGHMRLDLDCYMEGDYIHVEDSVVFPVVYKWMKARAEGIIDE
ncbi:MAG: carboxylesterase family protein [Clostridiales bacterium]|nr:carboxylesterase family protein [Clostridiales bacterium]